MNEFVNAMVELDMAITGNSPEKAMSQVHHYPQDIEKWLYSGSGTSGTWHLSDGGYSRVVFSEHRGRLFLTSNSTTKAKANWEAAAPQRQRVEEMVRNWMVANGWDNPFVEESRAKQVVDRLLEWGDLVANWAGFWMDSKCVMHRVDAHLSWARRWLREHQPDEIWPSDHQGDRNVYATMRKYGWFRVIVENNRIYVQPPKATKAQMSKVQEYAIENRMTVVDEQTGRTIYDPREDAGPMED